MAICSYFLQGRCKFGDRCWNEHPRDGRHHGHNRYQSQASAASPSWNSSDQRYVQPSGFSRNLTWTSRDNDRSSFGSGSSDNRNRNSKSNPPSGFFSAQNRFGALANQDQARDSGQDKEGSLLADIIQDFEIWESSGQWLLSVYCVLKEQRHLSGFTDISPEELRLECYTSHKEGRFQNYVSSVQQLANQWKQRIHEIKTWNPSSTSALLNQLTKPPTATTPSFGGLQQAGSVGGLQQAGSVGGLQQAGSVGGLQQSGFGASSTSTDKTITAATFSFKLDSNTAPPNAGASSGFPSAPASSFSFAPAATLGGAASTFPGFSSTAPSMAASGFGSSAASGFGSSAATGFGSSAASGFGSSVASGFGSSASSGFGGTTMTGGFGSGVSAVSTFGGTPSASGFGGLASSTATSGFGAVSTGASSLSTPGTSLFGQGATVSSTSKATTPAADTTLSSALFTPRNELSQEDLLQFESKMFTLGRVPLVPPPVDLLTIK